MCQSAVNGARCGLGRLQEGGHNLVGAQQRAGARGPGLRLSGRRDSNPRYSAWEAVPLGSVMAVCAASPTGCHAAPLGIRTSVSVASSRARSMGESPSSPSLAMTQPSYTAQRSNDSDQPETWSAWSIVRHWGISSHVTGVTAAVWCRGKRGATGQVAAWRGAGRGARKTQTRPCGRARREGQH